MRAVIRGLMVSAGLLFAMSGFGEQQEPGATVRAALFAEPNCTQPESRDGIYNLLSERDDIRVENVTTETVRAAGFFDNYDVLILPGGTGSGEANAIGVEAGKEIARRVRSGKGLVAICAGGYYVAEGGSEAGRALDIVKAKNHDGEHWARGKGMIAVEVLGVGESETSRTMWYENGPIFRPAAVEGLPEYVPLVKYVTDMAAEGAPTGQMAGRDAVVAAKYGNGRVVAFGPHPELSPQVNHWLVNAVKWAAGRTTETEINALTVLEAD